MYNPTMNSLLAYDILGEITIPMVAYDDSKREVSITGFIDKVFFPSKINPESKTNLGAPDITPGVSAFTIRLVNGSTVVDTIIGIVHTVNKYRVTRNPQNPSETIVHLDIAFDRVETDYRSPNIHNIEPMLTNIITGDNGFVALFFTGDKTACADMIKKEYRVFTHNGKVYHTCDGPTAINMMETADLTISVAVFVIASETEIPDVEGLKRFRSAIGHYVHNFHGVGGFLQ